MLHIDFLLRRLGKKYCVIIRPLQHLGWALAFCPELEAEKNSSVMIPLCGPSVHKAVEAFITPISQWQLWGTHCVQSIEHYGEHWSKEKAQLLLLKSFKFTGTV
jgi:hypothetical protein